MTITVMVLEADLTGLVLIAKEFNCLLMLESSPVVKDGCAFIVVLADPPALLYFAHEAGLMGFRFISPINMKLL